MNKEWTLLEKIPVEPDSRSTAKLRNDLRAEGYDLHIRSVQRILGDLSSKFPISCRQEGRGNCWYWLQDTKAKTLPSMPPSTALIMKLAEQHLEGLLPPKSRKALEPYFTIASDILGESALKTWYGCVRLLPSGLSLPIPNIDADVFNRVTDALIHGDQLDANYRPRGQDLRRYKSLNPLGLVLKDGITYLLATMSSHTEPVFEFALHRFTSVSSTEREAIRPPDFDIDEHIAGRKHFRYRVSNRPLAFKALVNGEVATHLAERPLSANQKITPAEEGCYRVSATVEDIHEFRWWLMAYGDKIEVLAPKRLRDEFVELAQRLHERYCQ